MNGQTAAAMSEVEMLRRRVASLLHYNQRLFRELEMLKSHNRVLDEQNRALRNDLVGEMVYSAQLTEVIEEVSYAPGVSHVAG